MTSEAMPPLTGIRVIELAGPATPFAGRQLAELGAEVILIEPPAGAPSRHRSPFLDGQPGPERSLHHLHFNAGKRSRVLDLETTEGAAQFRDLIADADALLESAAPGTLEALELGFDQLRELNPHLLYTAVAPFGREGPLAEYRGNDLIGAASSGLMYLNGFPEDPPNVPGAEQAYNMASLAAVSTLLVALVGRDRGDPKAHRLDISIQEAASIATIQTANANFYWWHQQIPKRFGISPTDTVGSLYQCADGAWISFVVPIGVPALWAGFREWLESEGIVEPSDERFDDISMRLNNPMPLRAAISELCSRHPRSVIFEEGQKRRMLAMPVNTAADLVADPHLRSRGFFVSTSVPQLDREVIDVSPPYRFTATPARRGMPAPRLNGGHDLAPRPARPQPERSEVAPGRPLEGIRICDFTWLLAGPLTTRILVDYGAEAIKIESQSRIDTIRVVGSQPTTPGSPDTNGVFNDANVNKRSIQLNLGDPRGIDLAKQLVAVSDVVTNNFTPSRMDRWGLGYEDLRRIKPDLVMLTMPVMSKEGPYKSYGSYGNGVIAFGGMSQNMGFPNRPPSGIAPLYSDFASPYFAASAILAALHHRERTGEGQFIELSQAEATVNLLGTDILEVTANGELPPRIGNRSRDIAPHGAFPCAGEDRWIAIACADDEDWRRLATALDLPGLASDPRFATLEVRRKHEDALEAAIAEQTRRHDAWELMHTLQTAGVMAAVVEDLEDMVTRDPHLQRHLVPVSGEGDDFSFLTHAQPARIDGEVPPLRRSPYFGEHNTEVYRDLLGLTDTDIAELVAAGVIY